MTWATVCRRLGESSITRSISLRCSTIVSRQLALGCRQGLKLEQVDEYGPDAARRLAALRLAQGLDLLGHVPPVDRQIGAGAAGVAQRARLVLGPERPIDVVFLIGLQAPPAYLPNAGYSARSSSASVPSVGSAT